MKKIPAPPTTPQTGVVTGLTQDGTSSSLASTPVSDPYARNDPRRISLLDSMEAQFAKIFGGQADEK